jgi:hypothetical protein
VKTGPGGDFQCRTRGDYPTGRNEMRPGEEVALKIDQFLLHDGTGPLCALQLDAMGVEKISGDTAVAYCDHLLVEADSKNADDHILLQSAARRFGMWFVATPMRRRDTQHQARRRKDAVVRTQYRRGATSRYAPFDAVLDGVPAFLMPPLQPDPLDLVLRESFLPRVVELSCARPLVLRHLLRALPARRR